MRIFEKLRTGHSPVVIGYLGGSITAGVGATHPESTSWRALTTRWFRERFPEGDITERDASLKGTGSELAAYRIETDLLRHRPDLIFVEFAVNDHRLSAPKIVASLEGLIRRARRMLPWTEIMIVLATMRSLAERHPGKAPAATFHEKIARHYEIPAVDVGSTFVNLIERRKATWESLTTDGCHPTDEGHAIIAREVRSRLEMIADKSAPTNRLLLPEPLSPERLEWGNLVPVATCSAAPPEWRYENEPVGPYLQGRLTSNIPGAALKFPFSGDAIGIYWLVAADSGSIDYVIDDWESETVCAWDAYASRSSRAHYRILADHLDAGRPHILRLRVSSTSHVQSNGSYLRIGAFLVHHAPA